MSALEAIEVLIAESLADSLTKYNFTQDFTAAMEFVPDFERVEADSLRVSVVPGSVEVVPGPRGADRHEVNCHVVIAKTIRQDFEMRALVKFRAEVADKIRSRCLPASDPAMPENTQYLGLSIEVPYDVQTARHARVFLAEITVTHQIFLEHHEA